MSAELTAKLTAELTAEPNAELNTEVHSKLTVKLKTELNVRNSDEDFTILKILQIVILEQFMERETNSCLDFSWEIHNVFLMRLARKRNETLK